VSNVRRPGPRTVRSRSRRRPRRYAARIVGYLVLGPLEVAGAAGPIAVSAVHERAALAALALSPGRVVGVDRLTDAIWGASPPPSSRKLLQNLVLRLRKALGPRAIETHPSGYVLVGDTTSTDAGRFEKAVQQARLLQRAGDAARAATTFSDALALWRGPAFRELEAWEPARAEAARLDELRRCAKEEWAEAALACGHHREVLPDLEMMVDAEPLRERRWGLLARALYGDGRQADALRALQRARSASATVGLDPGPDLVSLERSIAVRDSSLRSAEGQPSASVSAPGFTDPTPRLPVTLTRFIGRRPELATIDALLATERLVTLLAVGGAGKTRLALAVAGEAAPNFDETWFVDLAGVAEAARVGASVATTLGLRPGLIDDGDMARLIADRLAAGRVLLVLDNCEHLLEACAQLVEALLSRCADLTVMATAREPLGLPGEAIFAVPPMTVPPSDDSSPQAVLASDAGALFCDRAWAAQPAFVLGVVDAAAVATICRHLDGIPLAIELAAPWVRVLGVGELAARLDESFTLLDRVPRTARSQRQTLRAAIEWSYGRLSSADQAGLRWLGTFPDDFDLDAALELAQAGARSVSPGDAELGVELVARLVDASLVVVGGFGERLRYRLLIPIAHYARAELANNGELALAIGYHDRLFVNRAHARLRGGLALRADINLPSCQAALQRSWDAGDHHSAKLLALAAVLHWTWTGDRLGIEWMERLAEVPAEPPRAIDATVLSTLASLLRDSGSPSADRERALLQRAVSIGRGTRVEPLMTFALGELELVHGNVTTARELLQQARADYENIEAWVSVGWCDEHLGWVSIVEGDIERAAGEFGLALQTARRVNDDWLAAHAMAALAPVWVRTGLPAAGRDVAEQAVDLARHLANEGLLLMALTRAAEAATLAADWPSAAPLVLEMAVHLRRSHGHRWLADTLEIGALLVERDEPALGASLLCAAEVLRGASDEHLGGRRVATAEVRACRRRLADSEPRSQRAPGSATSNLLDDLISWLTTCASDAGRA
jgi:predicted ATPase/DNA-binding SARP family transcriptional activator